MFVFQTISFLSKQLQIKEDLILLTCVNPIESFCLQFGLDRFFRFKELAFALQSIKSESYRTLYATLRLSSGRTSPDIIYVVISVSVPMKCSSVGQSVNFILLFYVRHSRSPAHLFLCVSSFAQACAQRRSEFLQISILGVQYAMRI